MKTLSSSMIQETNAIMFADGETWYLIGKPEAALKTILNDYIKCGGNPSLTVDYQGLQFGTIVATNQQYADLMTTGLKDYFKPIK